MSSLCHYPLHHSAATVKTLVYSDSPRSEKYSKWYKKGSKGWFDLKIFLFFSEWEAYFFHGIGWCGSKETEVYNLGSPLSDQENDLSERSVPEWIFFLSFPPPRYFKAIFVISLYLQRLGKSWVSGEALCTPFLVTNACMLYMTKTVFIKLNICFSNFTCMNWNIQNLMRF